MKVDPIRHALNVGRFQFPVEGSQATTLAAANFELNRATLERIWPRTILALPENLPELEWLYARDGTLSARHVDGQWIGDVSVPRKAAERMFSRFVLNGTTGVLLAPTNAAQVRVALDHLTPHQTLIAVVPTELTAGAILACDDFSAEIAAGRLWLACGPDWAEELKAIFDGHEGIAPASMMIRVPGLNAGVVEAIQKPCEELLALHAQTQRQLTAMIHGKPRSPAVPPRKVLVLSAGFALWNDGPALLADLAAELGERAIVLDTSSPLNASTLKVARLAETCDAIITANTGRADFPPIVPDNVPWITWATTNRVPACPPNASSDRLILADAALREAALTAGWPAERTSIASEPPLVGAVQADATVAVIADCEPVIVPKAIEEMSSHRLVWDLAERELVADPLVIRASPAAFLQACAGRLGVPSESLPIGLMIETLVRPVFIREIVRGLRKNRAKFTVYGRGWEGINELADVHRGPVDSTTALRVALSRTAVLLDVWPGSPLHRARRAGRPTIRTWGKTWQALLGEIRSATLTTRTTPAPTTAFSIHAALATLSESRTAA